MTETVLLQERRGAILTATLNRPAKSNALNHQLITALDELAASLETPPPTEQSVRALVITGVGDRAFSAGADVADLVDLTAEAARDQMRRGQAVFHRIERLPIPVLAAINGVALGGGLELAMAADLRVAAPTARLGQPEIKLANLPGWGGTQRLPRLVGRSRALELILTGDMIDAARAHDIGLVNRLAADSLAATIELAEQLSEHSPVAIAGAKRAVQAGLEDGMTAGLLVEADAVAECCRTDAQHRAVSAFLHRGIHRS